MPAWRGLIGNNTDDYLPNPAACGSILPSPQQGTGESLVQGAKEGFVGAYDTAAGAAASTTDAVKDAASRLTGSSSDQQQQTGAGQQQQQAEEQRGGGFGQGSGSSSSPSGGGYAGGATSLKQAWEDLKHGGSKAPHATSIAVSWGGCW